MTTPRREQTPINVTLPRRPQSRARHSPVVAEAVCRQEPTKTTSSRVVPAWPCSQSSETWSFFEGEIAMFRHECESCSLLFGVWRLTADPSCR